MRFRKAGLSLGSGIHRRAQQQLLRATARGCRSSHPASGGVLGLAGQLIRAGARCPGLTGGAGLADGGAGLRQQRRAGLAMKLRTQSVVSRRALARVAVDCSPSAGSCAESGSDWPAGWPARGGWRRPAEIPRHLKLARASPNNAAGSLLAVVCWPADGQYRA